MAFLKPKAGHGSCRHVYNYLEHGEGGPDHERALAHDTNMDLDGRPWYEIMDETRRTAGHDKPTRAGGAPRSYYHYVLAPDPKDFEELSPEEGLRRVRELATRWAREYVPDNEWMIVYHDDSEADNIHAHVVVNVTNLATGRKHYESDRDLWRSRRICNRICEEVGLSPFDVRRSEEEVERDLDDANERRKERGESVVEKTWRPRGRVTAQARPTTLAEMHLRGRSWKSELRQAIDAAVMSAASFDDLRARLRNEGLDVYQNRKGELVYVWSDGKRKIRDFKLGKAYQTDLLATRFMDLRFTRSGWETNRGRWTRVMEDGERVPRVTSEEVARGQAIAAKYGCAGLEDVRLRMDAARESLRLVVDEAEGLEKLESSLERDLRDARLVEGLAPSIEPSRVDGRVVSAPVTEDVLRSYEAARKRLARRDHPVDSASLEEALGATRVRLAERRARVTELEEVMEDLGEAHRVASAIDAYVEAGAAAERGRYGRRVLAAAGAYMVTSRRGGHVRGAAVFVATSPATSGRGPARAEAEWQAAEAEMGLGGRDAEKRQDAAVWSRTEEAPEDEAVEVGYDQVAHPAATRGRAAVAEQEGPTKEGTSPIEEPVTGAEEAREDARDTSVEEAARAEGDDVPLPTMQEEERDEH